MSQSQTLIPATPCPNCRCTERFYQSTQLVCNKCRLTEAEAKYNVERYAKRDANGSLLCMTCKDPFPYAEPDDDGRFHCYDCRLTKRMKEEVAIKQPDLVTELVTTPKYVSVSASVARPVTINVPTNTHGVTVVPANWFYAV